MPFSLPNVPSMYKKVITIPKGREVFFKSVGTNGSNIFSSSDYTGYGGNPNSVHLILEDSIALDFSTSYNEIYKASGNVLGTLASTTFTWNGGGIGTGQFKQQGMKVWESTEAISCSMTVNLYMQTSGYIDVYLPAMYLVMKTLPSTSDNGWGLIAPGPGLTSVFNMKTVIPFTEKIEGRPEGITVEDAIKDLTGGRLQFQDQGTGLFWVEVDNYINLRQCVITKATPAWGDQFDEEGFPTKCQLSIDITTINIATTNDVDAMLTEARAKRKA